MSPDYTSHARRLAALSVSLLASTIALAACDDDPVDPVDAIEWEAELSGVGEYAEVEGIGALSATTNSFDAAVEIANATEDAVFIWEVAEGTCAQPGDRLGAATDYPDLEVAANGTASAEADVNAAVDEEEDYVLRVIDDSGNAPVVAACGAFEPAS